MDWNLNICNLFRSVKRIRAKEVPEVSGSSLERLLPTTVRFYPDWYRFGDECRCVWAIRNYPSQTADTALLSSLGEMQGVILHVYLQSSDAGEQARIYQNAVRKNRLQSTSENLKNAVQGEGNITDLSELLSDRQHRYGSLVSCTVFLEIKAGTQEELKLRQEEVFLRFSGKRISVDRLTLRQKEGFLSVLPYGFRSVNGPFTLLLPSSSVANLFPFGYSGLTDPHGLPIGKDRFGSRILFDPEVRNRDRTNGNILILGSSGQGKSYLMKLLLRNARLSGKQVLCLDPESEYGELAASLGGICVNGTNGSVQMNPLEIHSVPEAEEQGIGSAVSRHLSFLRDFFRIYKDFSEEQLDALEYLLSELYRIHGIDDRSWMQKKAEDYPTLSDLYRLLEFRLSQKKDVTPGPMFPDTLLMDLFLGLRSICIGADSRYFNGISNLPSSGFLCIDVKEILTAGVRLRDTFLFHVFSFLSSRLLEQGNTVAAMDELYLFLSSKTSVESIRNLMKRARKKQSSVYLASQNPEDFLQPEVQSMTKPLFSIPTSQFLFHPGHVPAEEFSGLLQLEPEEWNRLQNLTRGECLFRLGNARFLLQVKDEIS